MFHRLHTYTVHGKADDTQLVREGFSFAAFAFGLLWLLYHRVWDMALVFIGFQVLVLVLGARLGLSFLSQDVLLLGLQLWLAAEGNDMRRRRLAQMGYRLRDIVCAKSESLALQRFFSRRVAV